MGRKWRRRGAAAFLAVTLGGLCGCGFAPGAPTMPSIKDTKPTVISLEFPYIFPESQLVVEEVVYYQGQYWEDGSGDMVENVAGLMLYNPTERMIELEAVALDQGEEQLYFFVYRLPPMSRCLVLEKNRKSCKPEQITACRELSTRWEYQELSRGALDYVGLGPILTIVNRDSQSRTHITICYKRYVKEGDYYLGGIAYTAHLFDLQPEEQRSVTPEHYHTGRARIVAITVKQ